MLLSLVVKRVIFLCTENSNRSQMAEAFARLHGSDVVDASSAGSRPSGVVNPTAVAAMAEKGYDLGRHHSKAVADLPDGPYDYVITMGCGDACPTLLGHHRRDWELPDPRELRGAAFHRVRDEIERRVLDLLSEIRRA